MRLIFIRKYATVTECISMNRSAAVMEELFQYMKTFRSQINGAVLSLCYTYDFGVDRVALC